MIGGEELRDLESLVSRALASGTEDGLRVLGYGEISLVLGSPPAAPRVACKRLPVFRDRAAFERYQAVLERYLTALGERGVAVLETSLRDVTTDGGVVGYVVQPALPAHVLGPRVLAAAEPDEDHPLVDGIVTSVVAVVDDRVGIDAQVSNWALGDDGAVVYLDVTTPFLRVDGRDALDLDLFLSALPWALRGVVRRFVVPGVLERFYDRRAVLLDAAANLVKERLDAWLPPFLAAANRRLDRHIGEGEVRAAYAKDARLWQALLGLRRADRWWQRTVRRRAYPFLLPGPIER